MRGILSHKIYFSSFAENLSPCPKIRKFYPSEDSFCYEVLTLARKYDGGFIYIFSADDREVRVLHSSDTPRVFEREAPTLALDISEHAYFADYGFERDNYLKSAVARLDINKLF
jgi:superoxide dismutase